MFDVLSKLLPVASKWKAIGLALRLKPLALLAIQSSRPNDIVGCLSDMLERWLSRNYDVEMYGEPTWKMLRNAVKHPAGGNDSACAARI